MKENYILCFIIFILYLPLPTSAGDYSWNLKPIYEASANSFTFSDYENDGVDEIVEGIKCFVFVRDQYGFLQRQFTANENSETLPLGFFRLNDTLPSSLLISIRTGDTISLRTAFGNNQFLQAYIGRNIGKASIQNYDSQILKAVAADIDGDGFDEVVCKVNTGFDLYPRGIFVYDYKNNKKLWHYWIGCNPDELGNIFCVDIDNDTDKEIFFGTVKTSNGALENGVDDFHPWIIALTSDGKLLWKKKFNEAVNRMILCVDKLGQNQEYKLIACENGGSFQSSYVNQIMILNPKDGGIERYIQTGKQFMGMVVCDYNRDGKTEVIAGNSDGILRIFNSDLEVIAEKNFYKPITLSHIEDLDNDGRREMVLLSQDGSLTIINEKLQILGCLKSTYGLLYHLMLAKDRRRYNIATITPRFNEQILTVYQIDKVFALKRPQFGLLSLIIIIIILGSGLVLSITQNYRYIKRVRTLVDKSPAAVIILNRNNKISYYNEKTLQIIGKTKEEVSDFIQVIKTNKDFENSRWTQIENFAHQEKTLDVFYTNVGSEKLVIVTDRTSHSIAQNVISWAVLAQRLAHDIKNPLSTINLTLQRMCQICNEKFGEKAGVIEDYAKSILEEVERLRSTTDRFMRILSLEETKFTLTDINELLNETTKKYERTLPGGIKIEKIYTPNLPLIKCDEDQIATAFFNIIDNGIEAMDGKGVLTIRTSLIEAIATQNNDTPVKKYVEIKFEDTGRGISEKELKSLFKPFYSTKKGGIGLGLVIAKRIIEIHRGEINISSKKGIGTIVTVLLPVSGA